MKGRGAECKGESGERGMRRVEGLVGAVGELGTSGRDTKDRISGEGRARSSGTDRGVRGREGCGGGRPRASD